MSRISKLFLLSALLLFILACNLISNPINNVENVAETAQAFASANPLETLQSVTTALPVQTIESLPSAIPELGNYFDPSGTPVDSWKDIPIMPQAIAGEEFSDSVYGFTVPLPAPDVQAYYDAEMEALGWSSPFGLQLSESGGLLVYMMDTEIVSITIVPDQGGSNGVDVVIQK